MTIATFSLDRNKTTKHCNFDCEESWVANFMLISSVNDTYELGELNEINITTPSKSSWHLSNLNTTTKYKFYLRACTSRGCGKPISEEGATLGEGSKYMSLLHGVHSRSQWSAGTLTLKTGNDGKRSLWPILYHWNRCWISWSCL